MAKAEIQTVTITHKSTTMLTSKDLLYKALEYDVFWNSSKKMRDSTPSECRKQQLDKLLEAFGITKKNAKAATQVPHNLPEGHTAEMIYTVSGSSKSMSRLEYIKTLTDFKYFSTGEFIADADRAKYQALIAQIIATATTIFPEQSKLIGKEPVNLVQLFRSVYNFRLSLYHMFHYSFIKKTNAAFSLEDDYSLHLQKKFMLTMNDNFSEADELLCMLIDPEKRSFKEDEIAFPGYDFAAIDEAWHNELRKGGAGAA